MRAPENEVGGDKSTGGGVEGVASMTGDCGNLLLVVLGGAEAEAGRSSPAPTQLDPPACSTLQAHAVSLDNNSSGALSFQHEHHLLGAIRNWRWQHVHPPPAAGKPIAPREQKLDLEILSPLLREAKAGVSWRLTFAKGHRLMVKHTISNGFGRAFRQGGPHSTAFEPHSREPCPSSRPLRAAPRVPSP